MKKMSILFAFLVISSAASADTAWFEVDPADVKDSYKPSDVITINMVSDVDVFSMMVDYISSDNDGTAQEPLYLDDRLILTRSVGQIVNGGDPYILVQYISGSAPLGMPGVTAGDVIHSFEFHIPDVPYSTYITIDDYEDPNASPPIGGTVINPWPYEPIYDIQPLVIHVVPGCPTCPGDLDGDCWITIADFGGIINILSPTQDWDPPYKVPCTDPSYNPCADMDGNDWITVADLGGILEILTSIGPGPPPKWPCPEPCTPQ